MEGRSLTVQTIILPTHFSVVSTTPCLDMRVMIALNLGKLLNEAPVLKIAKEINKTPAQVLIRWSVQHEILTIPKSTKKEHVFENYETLNFELPNEAMDILDQLHSNLRVVPIENLQQKLDSNMEDGYKLKQSPCYFPKNGH